VKYAYFPGCSVYSSAREYGESCKAVSRVLGIELVEIPDWNCCGSTDAVYSYDPLLSIALPTRNLALAEGMNLDVVTLCSACYFTLSRANKFLQEDSVLKNKVDKILDNAGLKYEGTVKVRHYVDVLMNDVGVDKISEHVKVPLNELRVAPYYGCLLVRPPDIDHMFDNPEHPISMAKLIKALGASSVDYLEKTRCCGASLVLTEESVMMEMTRRILLSAKNAGADCIITPCPLCHFNLDAKQPDVESAFDLKINIPILHCTQLVGIAFGLNRKELGLNGNCISPKRLLQRFNIH
jgi:heterodisulfide reductase subunit B